MMHRLLLLLILLAFPLHAENPSPHHQRIHTIMSQLVGKDSQGRRPGSNDHRRVGDYLISQLQQLGFAPGGDCQKDGSCHFVQAFKAKRSGHVHTHGFATRGANIVGIFHPAGKAGQAPRLLLSAHYDHLGSDCDPPTNIRVRADVPAFCPGAADNAGGVAALLAALPELIAHADQSFAVAFWDLEEYGFQGSQAFAAQPTFGMQDVRLILNLDIIGLTLFPGMETTSFAIGAETGGQALTSLVRSVAKQQKGALDEQLLSYVFGHERNDNTSFFEAGWKIPQLLLSDGDGSVYHSPYDTLEFFNYDKAAAISKLVERMSSEVLNREQGFPYHAPSQLRGHHVPSGADARVIYQIASRALQVSSPGLNHEDRAVLQGVLARLGRIWWTSFLFLLPSDMQVVGQATEDLMELSRSPFH